MTTENKTEGTVCTVNYTEVAKALRQGDTDALTLIYAATLCERFARGELVERGELVRVAERCGKLQYQCSILEAQRDGRQPIHRATGAVPRADEHTDNPYDCGGPRKLGGT